MSRDIDLQMQALQLAIERMALLKSDNYAHTGGAVGLRSACVRGDLGTVQRLIQQGMNIDVELNSDGDTPLTKSIFNNQTHIALWLIDNGADIEKALKNGRTPLITAAGCGNVQVVDALLSAGVKIDRQMNNGATALMYAISKGLVNIAHLLVAHGASKTLKDNDGYIPNIAS